MKTITLKNLPERVYERLKVQAKINHRSLNSEIIYWLEKSLGVREIATAEETIEKARRIRERINVTLTDEEISNAKRTGRS